MIKRKILILTITKNYWLIDWKKMKLEDHNKNNKTAELIENINFNEEFYL